MGLTDGIVGDSYGFSRDIEIAIAYYCATNQNFWGRVGGHLDPRLLVFVPARLAVEATKEIALTSGNGPTSTMLVLQRLRDKWHDGKATEEEIMSVVECFEDFEDIKNQPSHEGLIAAIVPTLQRRATTAAVRMAINETAKPKANLRSVVNAFSKVHSIGVEDTSEGIRIGPASFSEIHKLRRTQRLPTGVDELDTVLNGGLARRAMGVLVGEAGSGKSMGLSHMASHCMYNGLSILYATLEIPEGEVLARIKANITDLAIDGITDGTDEALCIRRLNALSARQFKDRPGLGFGVVKEFPASVTTPRHIEEWVARVAETEGREIDAVFVDYADRMSSGNASQSGYDAMRVVYEGLRHIPDSRNSFLWTASQATRNTGNRKRNDLDTLADSQHKVRIADLVVTINLDEEGNDIEWFVAKHRTGKSRVTVGPMAHDWAHGMMAPCHRGL